MIGFWPAPTLATTFARAQAEDAFKRQYPEICSMYPARAPDGSGLWILSARKNAVLREIRVEIPESLGLWDPKAFALVGAALKERMTMEDSTPAKKAHMESGPHPSVAEDIRAAMALIGKVNSYRRALDELMLASGYVPNRAEMEDVPSDVEAFVKWFKETNPVAARDKAQKECADWKRSYENQDAEKELQRVRKAFGVGDEEGPLEAWAEQFLRERDELEEAKLIPSHGESLTVEQYVRALAARRTVRIEGFDPHTTVLVREDCTGKLLILKERVRVSTGQDEHEIRRGNWEVLEQVSLPLGTRRYTVDPKDEISFEDAMKLLESKNVLHAPRYKHSVAYRNYRGRRSYLMTGADGFPTIYVFSDVASGLEPLGFRPIVFEDLQARWVLTDLESEQERPVSAMVKEGLLKRSLASYSGE